MVNIQSLEPTRRKRQGQKEWEKLYHIKATCYCGCRSRLASGMQKKQCYLNKTTEKKEKTNTEPALGNRYNTDINYPISLLAQSKQKSSGRKQVLWRSSYWTSPLPTTFAHLMEISSCKKERKKKKSYLQTLSELKWKDHIPQWLRSVLPWSLVWHAPQPAPLVAGAINKDQKQNKIICFLNY